MRHDDVKVVGIVGLRRMGKTTLLFEKVRYRPRLVLWLPARRPEWIAHTFDRGSECADWIRARPAPHVLRCALVSPHVGDFEDLVAGVVESGGRLTLGLDEIQLLNRGNTTEPNPRLEWCIAVGRNLGIEVFWTARQMREVGRLLRGQTEELYSFRQVDPDDISEARSRFGRERAERLPSLPQYHYLRALE